MRIVGPCFNPHDNVECSFGGVVTPGIYDDDDQILVCVSPLMDIIGRVEVTVTVTSDDKITFEQSAPFYSSKFTSPSPLYPYTYYIYIYVT